ncbi:hypothetical protein CHUAL_004480 [Chamberlinius hualienensis]
MLSSEMSILISSRYQGKIKSVIFDWAGTVVDCGCTAPVATFIELFKKEGISVTVEEARGPMGLHKRDHIKKLMHNENIKNQWIHVKGSEPNEHDVDRIYVNFVPQQLITQSKVSSVIDGVPETVDYLKNVLKLKIGSCSGYPKAVLNELIRTAALNGFSPDTNVAADEVSQARPCPYMIWMNAIQLGIHPMRAIIKVDDTFEGIREGMFAGCWTVGVTKTGNYVGATETELKSMKSDELARRIQVAQGILMDAGAHYVIESVKDLPSVITDINNRLSLGVSF